MLSCQQIEYLWLRKVSGTSKPHHHLNKTKYGPLLQEEDTHLFLTHRSALILGTIKTFSVVYWCIKLEQVFYIYLYVFFSPSIYTSRSQAGPQKPPHRQDSIAATPGFGQVGFPSRSATAQIQNQTFAAKQPVKQQPFSRNINPHRASFTPSDLTARSPRPADQSQSSQWKIKPGGLRGGTWVEDTFGTSGIESNIQQQVNAKLPKNRMN